MGLSVLDELLFYEFTRSGATDPVLGVLERIRDARLTRPGLILYPLHSFGIYGAGILHTFTKPTLAAESILNGVAPPAAAGLLPIAQSATCSQGIADSLVLTVGSIEKYVSSIFERLGLPSTRSESRRVLAVLMFLRS